MHYWWVNQNKTYKQEIEGGYLWSPKRKSDGTRNPFYDYMTQAEAGDVVFSFRGARISDLGIVQRRALTAPKPVGFDEGWETTGWLVPVAWERLKTAVRPKDHIERLRKLLPDRYSPLQASGNGNQTVYLTELSEPLGEELLQLAGLDPRQLRSELRKHGVHDHSAVERLDDEVEKGILQDDRLDATTRDALVKARRGQGRFRRNLEELEPGCRITGVCDRRFLRASHIKPWRLCSSASERLDGHNGLLLAPNIDLLFDQGYVSFQDDGRLLVSERVSREELQRLGVPVDAAVTAGRFSPQQQAYLKFHRENVYLG